MGFAPQKVFGPFRFQPIAVSGWMNNQRQMQVIDYLRDESRVLREQLGDRRLRLSDHQRCHARDFVGVASETDRPEARWNDPSCAGPRTAEEFESLVVRMAEENRDWGYRRIQGALSNLGHELARSMIARILERHGIEPAPERIRKMSCAIMGCARPPKKLRISSSRLSRAASFAISVSKISAFPIF
jgi:hypothetical protein